MQLHRLGLHLLRPWSDTLELLNFRQTIDTTFTKYSCLSFELLPNSNWPFHLHSSYSLLLLTV